MSKMKNVKSPVQQVLKQAQNDIESLLGQPVQLTLVLLATDNMPEEKRKELHIKNVICDVCDVNWLQLKSPERKRAVVMARQLFCYFMKEVFGEAMSLKAIGEQIGDRDHTTVIHSIQTVKDLVRAKDDAMTVRFNLIHKMLFPKK